MKISYYKNEHGGYLAVTAESPEGFKGTLYIGKGPASPADISTIQEECFAVGNLKKLTSIALEDMPDEWVLALGYEQPVKKEPKPKRKKVLPKPAQERKPLPPYSLDLAFPWEGEQNRSVRRFVYCFLAILFTTCILIPAFTETVKPRRMSQYGVPYFNRDK